MALAAARPETDPIRAGAAEGHSLMWPSAHEISLVNTRELSKQPIEQRTSHHATTKTKKEQTHD